jgi:hypothetical protein
MAKLVLVVLIAIGGYMTYQKYHADPLYGEWVLDVETMSRQLAAQGTPEASINIFVSKNNNGLTKMVISRDKMVITSMGKENEFSYTVTSKTGKCTKAKVNAILELVEYCVNGNTLETRDPRTSLIGVFKRT